MGEWSSAEVKDVNKSIFLKVKMQLHLSDLPSMLVDWEKHGHWSSTFAAFHLSSNNLHDIKEDYQLRMKIPKTCNHQVRKVIFSCWDRHLQPFSCPLSLNYQCNLQLWHHVSSKRSWRPWQPRSRYLSTCWPLGGRSFPGLLHTHTHSDLASCSLQGGRQGRRVQASLSPRAWNPWGHLEA